MQQAVIETGGKQYLVSPKDKVIIEKLVAEAGDTVIFDKVLLVADGEAVNVGKPYISGSKVTAKVLEQGKADKLVIFKYKAKSRYRRKTGHRQKQTTVEIETIAWGGVYGCDGARKIFRCPRRRMQLADSSGSRVARILFEISGS